MGFKIKVCLTVIFVILILITIKFYTLSLRETKKNVDKEKIREEIKLDNPSILPDWKDGGYHD